MNWNWDEQSADALGDGQFLTLASGADVELTVRRSRFIGSARPANSKGVFDAALREIAQAFPKANHYCWAYRFYGSPPTEHASDAGEPSGSAGRPILNSIKQLGLHNCMVVVTRYFGGVKLGIPGLIEAYSRAARVALEACAAAVDEPRVSISISCDYQTFSTLSNRAASLGIAVDPSDFEYAEGVRGVISAPAVRIGEIRAALDGMMNGSGALDYDVI